MEYTVSVESPSKITRKLTIKVPAKVVANRFERGLAEVQRTANLKGFRPGSAPLSIIKQYYGDDIRHRVYHALIDESFSEAVREQKLKAIGSPKIDSPEHQHGAGEHDHSIHEDKDFTFTATVEILPEIEVKNYTGVALTRETVEITDEQVETVVKNLVDSHAQLVPATSGLAMADGTQSSRPIRKGDFVDLNFDGGIVTPTGVEKRPDMKGNRVIEIGSDTLIPGFEDQLVGLRSGDAKTLRVPFPADFYEKELAGKESEFDVVINEVKEKKLPELTDDFVKELGYENVADLRKKAREFLLREKTQEADQKLRGELIKQLVERNSFDVPMALVESQTRALAQDWAEQMKQQGVDDNFIREAIGKDLDSLRKRAEAQVRASLLLEAVATKEKIEVSADDFGKEVESIAVSMKADPDKVKEFYAKNPGRREDLEFRLRQDRTLKFLLDSAKIKAKS